MPLKKESQQHFPNAKLNLIRCFTVAFFRRLHPFTRPHRLHNDATTHKHRNSPATLTCRTRKSKSMGAERLHMLSCSYTKHSGTRTALHPHTQKFQTQLTTPDRSCIQSLVYVDPQRPHHSAQQSHTHSHTHTGTHTHMFGSLWVQLSLQRRHSKLDLLGTAGLHYY